MIERPAEIISNSLLRNLSRSVLASLASITTSIPAFLALLFISSASVIELALLAFAKYLTLRAVFLPPSFLSNIPSLSVSLHPASANNFLAFSIEKVIGLRSALYSAELGCKGVAHLVPKPIKTFSISSSTSMA